MGVADFARLALYFQRRFKCDFLDSSTYYCVVPAKGYSVLPTIYLDAGSSRFAIRPEDYVQFVLVRC